jgi:urease accessory protein
MVVSCYQVESSSSAKELPEVWLDFDQRKKSRFKAFDSEGQALEVYLPHGTVLRGGMILVGDDGRRVRVNAKPQSLSEVRGDAAVLLPVAYHLGNRHLPLEIETTSLRYESDHVIDDMVRHLGLVPTQIEAPFEPIDGAYKHHHHEP